MQIHTKKAFLQLKVLIEQFWMVLNFLSDFNEPQIWTLSKNRFTFNEYE
jgi:hypothetical protein